LLLPQLNLATASRPEARTLVRAKRIEFFRREDDSMASGRGLDAGGKTSLNGDEGRAMGI